MVSGLAVSLLVSIAAAFSSGIAVGLSTSFSCSSKMFHITVISSLLTNSNRVHLIMKSNVSASIDHFDKSVESMTFFQEFFPVS